MLRTMMIKVGEDLAGDVTWCPECGIVSNTGGYLTVPEVTKAYFAACSEHSEQLEKQIVESNEVEDHEE